MKIKMLSFLAVVLMVGSSLNANASITETQLDGSSSDCFEMAMGVYDAALFTYGGDRARALELAAGVYDDCEADETAPYSD